MAEEDEKFMGAVVPAYSHSHGATTPGLGVTSQHVKGTAKLWNDEKSYGFITAEDGSDVFVHSKPNDGASLVPGQDVWYTLGLQPDGRSWALELQGPGVAKPPKVYNIITTSDGQTRTTEAPLPLGTGHRGRVKSWYEDKAFGFILHDNGRDVFCHTKGINYGSLVVGQEVTFSIEYQQNGKQWATNCTGPGYQPPPGKRDVPDPGTLDPYGYGQYQSYGGYYPYGYSGYNDVGGMGGYYGAWGQYPVDPAAAAAAAAAAAIPAIPSPVVPHPAPCTSTPAPTTAPTPKAPQATPPTDPTPDEPSDTQPLRRRKRGFDDVPPAAPYNPY